MAGAQEADATGGQEIALINGMLSVLAPKIKGGDEAAIDRAIKLLQLKRLYKQDKRIEDLE